MFCVHTQHANLFYCNALYTSLKYLHNLYKSDLGNWPIEIYFGKAEIMMKRIGKMCFLKMTSCHEGHTSLVPVHVKCMSHRCHR